MGWDLWLAAAVGAAALALGALTVPQMRRRLQGAACALARLDTVAAWPAQPTRVLSAAERRAYESLVLAVPQHIVLAQVPIARFLKVPRRHSYSEWMRRVGALYADLLVCNAEFEVLAVVDIHAAGASERSRRRHERMQRVLQAAGVRLLVWIEEAIPDPEAARRALLPMAADDAAASPDAASAAMREPASSTWYDELDPQPMPAVPRR